jgi:membrane protein YqaA with SNARE-associated domain
MLILTGLFVAAFVAATVFPFNSEVVFVGLQTSALWPVWVLVVVAGTGNTLGAVVNYWIGANLDRPGLRNRLRLTEARMARAQRWWARWGMWSLLLSWAPLIGMLTVVAGTLRMPMVPFLALVGLAKFGRYAVLGWVTQQALARTAFGLD